MRSWSCGSDRIDLSSRALQNLLDLPDLLRRSRRALRRRIDRATNILESAVHFHHRLSENVLRKLGDAREDVIDQRLVLSEMLPTFVGDLVDLLAALFRPRCRIAQILEHRQRRINGSRTR